MPLFYCASNSARSRGAIGIFHFVERVIEASDLGQAEEKFRELFECHGLAVLKFSGQMRLNDPRNQ